jgi:RNA polymerase sigma-70 factor (ECF subfamily)
LDEAVALLRRAAELGRSGPYQVMAAIHATHASRKETGATPWADVLALYDALIWMRPSPVAKINRAVALGHVVGPQAALEALGEANAEGRVEAFAPYHAARAHLLEQVGRIDEAVVALARSLELVQTPAERDYLTIRLESLSLASSRRAR